MHFSDYLSRIGLTKRPEANLEGLQKLQDSHMRHVPFENLDVILRRPLDLSVTALFEKIITQKRGGYCFELNTLYGALLKDIGFTPVPMMARVWLRNPSDVPPRTHLVNRVKIGTEDWVSDVGFGGRAARLPLKMEDGYEIDDGDGRIRILADPDFGYRISRLQDGIWSDQYTVEPAAAHKSDILSGNHWTENHPESFFRHGIGVGLFTKTGRTSFYGGVLIRRGQDMESKTIKNLNPTLRILKTEFGLDIEPTEAELARLETVLS